MDSLNSSRVTDTLQRLFKEGKAADRVFMASYATAPEQAITQFIAAEVSDLRGLYHSHADKFLSVSPEFGKFIYMCARACKAKRIVEFGTSMGISAIHLAAALRDMGGGQLIGTELETSKVSRARANLEAAGLDDLADIRAGDALETLKDVGGDIDLVLLDGAFSLYLPVLKLLEPHLRAGALILAENAFEQAGGYLAYVRDPANGYLSHPIPVNEGHGNEFTIVTR